MTALAKCRVMVVEDLFYLAMEIESLLVGAGAQVVGPFANIQDATRSLQMSLPDCALLDVNLGDSNSFELARALRVRQIPFLFFTGYDRNALPAEFADVERLEKPIDPAQMLRAVQDRCRSAVA